MRNITDTELQNDVSELKYHIITEHVADRLTQTFHFDDFFKNQIDYWAKMPMSQQTNYLHTLQTSLKMNLDELTFNKFFTMLASNMRTYKYTNFNVNMMNKLIQKYHPTSVFDPCAGWGHRMLMCQSYGIEYLGIDIRQESIDNNRRMGEYVGDMDKIHLICDDGASQHVNQVLKDSKPVDMMFTCPPYFSDEIYSDIGAENKSHNEFLNWWKQIITICKENNIKYVAFQITQKYGEELKAVTTDTGYNYVTSIRNTRRTSPSYHSNTKGEISKRQYGQIYIFEME